MPEFDRDRISGMFGPALRSIPKDHPRPSLAEIMKAFSDLPKDGKPTPYILGPGQRGKP